MVCGNIFQRAMQYIANELIVKGLANNPAFQRFAVRSSEQAKDMTKNASQMVRSLAESENVAQLRREGKVVQQQARNFAAALREEIGASLRGDRRGPPSPPTPPRKA